MHLNEAVSGFRQPLRQGGFPELRLAIPERKITFVDNAAPVHPRVARANIEAARYALACGHMPPYGEDPITGCAVEALNKWFPTLQKVVWGRTGTLMNALGTTLVEPDSTVYVERGAHILELERGCTHRVNPGVILRVVGTEKISPADIESYFADSALRVRHSSCPHGLIFIENPNPLGRVYTMSEIKALRAFARSNRMLLGMDGARFGCTGHNPIEVTNCLDFINLSFSKIGGSGSALLLLSTAACHAFRDSHIKQVGALEDRLWGMTAGVGALFRDDLWLRLGRHQARAARQLADMIEANGAIGDSGIQVKHPVESNLVFVQMPPNVERAILRVFHDEHICCARWGRPHAPSILRFAMPWSCHWQDLHHVVRVMERACRLMQARKN